jgi:putative ABC transport system permease protein
MAIRASVGAGRARLAAQMLTESLLLAAIGGVIGMGLAVAAVRAVPAIRAIEIPRAEEIAVNREFLLIGLGISLASGILFGLAPAFQAWRRDLIASLHRGDSSVGRLGGQHVRDALVAAQLALVMVLLTGAGLMTNTLFRLLNIDLGLARSNVFTVAPFVPRTMFPPYDPKADAATQLANFQQRRILAAQFLRQVAGQVRHIPGVESVSVANVAPLSESYGGYSLSYTANGAVRKSDALGRDVDPGYFRTAGIPLLAGRDFEPGDASRKPVPVVLNRPAARALFGGDDPLGKVVAVADRRVGAMQVVGIVGDVRMLGVSKEPGPQAFAPLMGGWGFASVVIARATAQPAALARLIRAAVRSLDADSPPPVITTLDEVFAGQVAKPRFYMTLLNCFAALGLTLAAIGVYGVMAYTVARRTHEFGVRFALGARPGNIVRLVLASGARAVGAGAIVGLAGALIATRFLSSLLFEVKPRDPLTFAFTGVSLVGIALAACGLAARRATTVDLSVALRRE